jgi:hypothetical protein
MLVMCEACGRPQFATQATCIACGATLPETKASGPQVRSARDQLIAGYEPFLEADFGRGRLLLLSEKQLEWRDGARRPLLADLAQIEAVTLRKRRVWETLLPAGLISLAAIWPARGWAQVALAAFAGLWVIAGVLQRRCALVVRMKDGRRASIPLGVGTPRWSGWTASGPR